MRHAIKLGCGALLVVSGTLRAQASNTDIFLAPLERIGDSIVVGAAKNITNRAGYDNQPSFLPDSRAILYTVVGADGQADIWRYEIGTKTTARVTATPESEYSATMMPGGKRMSVIRVERDSTQRLWSFALDGSDPEVVLTALKPVGYHAWLNDRQLVAFVLGAPSTLHVIDRDGGHDEIRATDIGRALHRIPGRDAYSFTQRDSAKMLWIKSQPIAGGPATTIAPAMADNEFHAWTPDGVLLSASNRALVKWKTVAGFPSRWSPTADFVTAGVKNVSRIAVSPDGKWLAFVAEPVAVESKWRSRMW
jgi:WD40 repeat protein